MRRRILGATSAALVLLISSCGGSDDGAGSIEKWCALGPTLDEVSAAMGSADFTDAVALEGAMSTLEDSLDEMESAAPEEIEEDVAVFVQGNRDFASEFEEVGYDVTEINGEAAARAVESYTAAALTIDAFTEAQCDEPFLLFDEPVENSTTGDDDFTAGESEDPAQSDSTVTALTELELLDEGADDGRVRLDTPPQPGDTWSGEMLVVVGLAVNGEHNDVPSSIVNLTIEVDDVGDDDSVTLTSEVTGVRTYSPDNFDAAVIAEYEPRAETMIGTSSTWTVDASGSVGEIETSFPDDIDPTLSEGLQLGDRASDQMSVPLPDEPVGIGARWRTTQTTDLNGVKATLTTEYELIEVDGDLFHLVSTLSQALSVADGEATGSGWIRQQIGGLAPIESSNESDGTYEVEEENGTTNSLRITTQATVTQLD